MTRYHYTLIAAALLIALSIVLKNFILLISIVFLLLIVITLGSLMPCLSFFGNFICQNKKLSQRYVALTFDDGPDANTTPALLSLLQQANIPATFFAIGKQVTALPELAARIVQEGHLLENHSYSHSYATNFFSVAKLETELSKTQNVIQQATNTVPRYFRPPLGFSNPRVFRAAKNAGLKVIGWSTRAYDTKINNAERIVARIMRRLKAGSIILLHDGKVNTECLLTTVTLLLTKLKELNYEVVRLDKLL